MLAGCGCSWWQRKHCEILVQNYSPNEPVVVEVNAILWALQIVKEEDFKHITVEGMQKFVLMFWMVMLWRVCGLFQVFVGILSFLHNLFLLACLIGFLGKQILYMVHFLIKFAAQASMGSLCDYNSIPPPV